MALVTLPPSPGFTVARFALERDDVVQERTSGSQIVVRGRIAAWQLRFSLPPVNGADFRAWRSALAQLSTLENTFTFPPPASEGPSTGYSGPGPLVQGAGQLGTSLTCDGVNASTAILSEGDYLEVEGELKVATADASSDGVGVVTFNFEPALRAAPPDNAPVEIFAPEGTFRLAAPRGGWDVSLALAAGIQLEAREAI